MPMQMTLNPDCRNLMSFVCLSTLAITRHYKIQREDVTGHVKCTRGFEKFAIFIQYRGIYLETVQGTWLGTTVVWYGMVWYGIL